MKKTVVVLLFTLLILLSGCSDKETIKYNYLYKGESQLWTGEYSIIGTGTWTKEDNRPHYDSYIKEVLTVTYKNDVSELSNVQNIKIEYKAGSSRGSLTENYDSSNPLDKKTFTLNFGGQKMSEPQKDIVIKVKVIINNDDEQTLELKCVN